MYQYVLKLYINGSQHESMADSLRLLLNRELGRNYRLIIIDLSSAPAVAEQDQVVATPTLIKLFPPPPVRLVGDILDGEGVLAQITKGSLTATSVPGKSEG